MVQDNKVNWLRRLTLIAAILALCVVVLGAFVRLSDAGLGCPDWPGCYGELSVPQSEQAIQHAQNLYPDKPVVAHKAWKEMTHRYFAGTLGLLILVICILAWRVKRQMSVSPILPTALLLVVMLQAALGMWTVTLLLKPVIVTAHLLGGMTTLALLMWMSHRYFGVYSKRFLPSQGVRLMVRGAILIVIMQVFLGGWTSSNYAAMACTDFPTCHGSWVPQMDFSTAFHFVRELGQTAAGKPLDLAAYTAIQWTHRLGALLTFVYLGALALLLMRHHALQSAGLLLLLVLLGQVSLGIANLVLHLPILLAVGHNFGAALLVITIVIINSKITGFKSLHL